MTIQELLNSNPTDISLDEFEIYVKTSKGEEPLIARAIYHFPSDDQPYVVLEQG